MNYALRHLACLAVAVALLLAQPSGAQAQIEWEYTPYEIKVWLALEPAAEITPALRAQLRRDLQTWSESWHGGVWTVEALDAPPELATDMTLDLNLLDAERIESVQENVFKADKLVLAAVDVEPAGYRVSVRQLDCRTRVFSHVFERRAAQLDAAALLLFDGLLDTFTPLARVEKAIGRSVEVRLRAGGLIVGDSPARVPVDAVFLPVIRRNDRRISVKPEYAEIVPWTYLQATSKNGSLYECELISGVRNAISGKSGRRTEKLALAVRPRHETTRLTLLTNGDDPRPLIGYEVSVRGVDYGAVQRIFRGHCYDCHGFKKREAELRLDEYDGVVKGSKLGPIVVPGKSHESPLFERLVATDEKHRMPKGAPRLSDAEIDLIRRWIDGRALEAAEPQLVGLSDFDGAVDVPPAEQKVRVLYVKHGAQLLARLPLYPGVEAVQTATIPDDDLRLEAEGTVISLQRSYMDSVTRRQVLALQIRKRIEGGQFAEAEKLIERLRTFETRTDYTNRLDLSRHEYDVPDSRTQMRIDLMFGDARTMFNRHLDPRLADDLAQQLAQARRGG